MNDLFEALEFDKVLSYISEYAICELGKEKCKSAILFDNLQKIESELTLTNCAKLILDKAYGVSDFPLGTYHDAKKIIQQHNTAKAIEAQDIINLTKNLSTARLIFNFLEKNSEYFTELANLRENLYINKFFEEKVENTFDNALEIKDSASVELKNLRRSKKDTEVNIRTMVTRLMSNSTFTNYLQDSIYTIRDERIVFQVKAESKNKVRGIVHDVSASGQTFFIEPQELVEINNKLREINIKIQAEKDRIISALTLEILDFADKLIRSTEQLSEFDFIFAKAKYAIKTGACMPKITNEKVIELKGMRNPVLMRVCEKIVENDFKIGEDFTSLIISGSNTGGKTVVLKTVGLAVLMAKAGCFIPAYSAEIYPFKQIFAEIGDNQNIIQSLSTFSSHMKNLVEIVNKATSETLVLIDEITAGTDPKEGATLAQTILEYIQKRGAFCLVTTHFSELKSMGYNTNGFKNASVEFDCETLKPTYRLFIGVPGVSHAIEIAENLGLKPEIILKSKEIYFMVPSW